MKLRPTAAALAGAAARRGLRAAPLAVAGLALLLLGRGRVEARVDDALLGMGAQMMRYGGALVQDGARTLAINGAALWLSAGATADPVDAVLDEYESRCAAAPDGDGDGDGAGAGAADRGAPGDPGGDAPLPFGAPLRGGDAGRGFVACLAAGSPLGADGLVERARAFVDGHDLASLGPLHYVYAERRGDTTHFIVLRADGGLDVERMFPAAGDAPGADAPGIARPPDSRRRLSLREVGHPYGVTVYGGSPRSIDELQRYYRDALAADGWRIVRRSPTGEGPAGQAHYAAVRDGALALVVFGAEPSGTSTTILTTSLSGRGGAGREAPR